MVTPQICVIDKLEVTGTSDLQNSKLKLRSNNEARGVSRGAQKKTVGCMEATDCIDHGNGRLHPPCVR